MTHPPARILQLLSQGSLVQQQMRAYVEAALKKPLVVSPEEILAALNGGAGFGERRLREAERILKTREPYVYPAPREHYAEATKELEASLRLLVDEWLNTGRREDGSEYPWKRNLSKTQFGLLSWLSFVRQCPPIQGEVKGSLCWITPAVRPLAGKDYPIDAAIEEAQRLFAGLMLADWKACISKCRYCGRYYLIRTPQQIYKAGTFERDCHKRFAAEERRDEKRATSGSRRMAAARKAFAKDGKTHFGLDLKLRITAAVNKVPHPGDDDITKKWVTRNWDEITKIGE